LAAAIEAVADEITPMRMVMRPVNVERNRDWKVART
jgi:hypothetical protein